MHTYCPLSRVFLCFFSCVIEDFVHLFSVFMQSLFQYVVNFFCARAVLIFLLYVGLFDLFFFYIFVH